MVIGSILFCVAVLLRRACEPYGTTAGWLLISSFLKEKCESGILDRISRMFKMGKLPEIQIILFHFVILSKISYSLLPTSYYADPVILDFSRMSGGSPLHPQYGADCSERQKGVKAGRELAVPFSRTHPLPTGLLE